MAVYPGQTPPEERAELAAQIAELKKERGAILLVHNYQLPETQAIADLLGDSLELSCRAAETAAAVIVFCGVHFMAQTAKLLSPERPVLLPDAEAGCPMADMIDPPALAKFKAQHPGLPVVAYVNTTAEVKAESDICCTSANAVKVVESIDAEAVLFIPDKYLADWVGQHTEKQVIPYKGFCPTHAYFTAEMIEEARREHPGAAVMCHPECPPEVTAAADIVASTSGMVRAAGQGEQREFIIATEWALACRMAKDRPEKRFYVFPEAVCPNMKRINLAKVAASLRDMRGRIEIAEEVAARARGAVERMLAVV
jgi:quinolinate synthase